LLKINFTYFKLRLKATKLKFQLGIHQFILTKFW